MNDERISRLLVDTEGYKDLDAPVILTSGELGIYYVNTERLCRDGGRFREFGDDSSAMYEHAVQLMEDHSDFQEVVEIVADKVDFLLLNEHPNVAISGGQRRDWLFSAPVAEYLSLPHISLYKDGRLEVLDSSGDKTDFDMKGVYVVHVADLLTQGSSAYRVEGSEAKGWIPMLREAGARVDNLVAVVSRLQGGEQDLQRQGVQAHSFVEIGEEFLKKYSKDAERAVAYFRNPGGWSESYLSEHGALELADFFDPAAKDDRAMKFLDLYGPVIEGVHMDALAEEVKSRYDVDL